MQHHALLAPPQSLALLYTYNSGLAAVVLVIITEVVNSDFAYLAGEIASDG